MSFFDETDESRTTDEDYDVTQERDDVERDDYRERPRRRSGGGGDRPTASEIQHRRIGLVVVLVIVVLLFALLIRGCSSGTDANALKNYNAAVSNLITQSDKLGQSTLTTLQSGKSLNTAGTLTTKLDSDLSTARQQLAQVESLSVPSSMNTAQGYVRQVFIMRRDAIQRIAANAQGVYATATASTSAANIANAAATMFSSDVVYKNYAGTAIAMALNNAGVTIGGTNGVTINSGQVLPSLGWLQASTVMSQMSGSGATTHVNTDSAGTHGHQLNTVSVGSQQLSTTSTNSITTATAPKFTFNLSNSGTNNEYDVVCKVTLSGASSLSGTTTIPETYAQQSATCEVQLSSVPTAGTYTVTATVEPVTGETVTSNNTKTYTVTFSN